MNDRPPRQPRSNDDAPGLVRRLRVRRKRYSHRPLWFRIGWTVAGFLVVIAGIVMLVMPGPAFVFIPAGLAMLSFEFGWAARMLDWALCRGMDAKQYAQHLDKRQKWMAITAGIFLALAGAAAAYFYWR